MSDNKLLIENLILSDLAADDETAGQLIKDNVSLDEETKKRLKSQFLDIVISEIDVIEALRTLWKNGLIECIHENGKTVFKGKFEEIPIEIENYEIWFKLTEQGSQRLEETDKLIWDDN
jgi:hypothetical protein